MEIELLFEPNSYLIFLSHHTPVYPQISTFLRHTSVSNIARSFNKLRCLKLKIQLKNQIILTPCLCHSKTELKKKVLLCQNINT